MKKLGYIATVFTAFNFFQLNGQIVNQNKRLNISFDLAGPVKTAFDKGYLNLEGAISFGSLKNFYPIVEFGIQKYNTEVNDNIDVINSYNSKKLKDSTVKNNYTYTSKGNYFRIGFDYNTFKKNLPGENNQVSFGLRYGSATMAHTADNIIIRDNNWGDFSGKKFNQKDMKTNWLEIVGGIKIELLKNFTLGWTMRLNFLLSNSGMSETKPFFVPGYGRGNKSFNLGYTYTVGYNFNFY